MFTGIVEETGRVLSIKRARGAIQLTVQAAVCGRGMKLGDSVSVNGCCLTAVTLARKSGKTAIRFDLLEETWRLTNLQYVKPGSRVNLERALRADSRLGGHFVSGHVDGTGRILRWERSGQDHILEIAAPRDVMRYVVYKGSIAVDGISLTVAGVKIKSFKLWIIPHTYEATALRERAPGDLLNLEADLLGKYVEKFVGPKRLSGY